MAGRRSRKRPWGELHRALDENFVRNVRHSEVGPDGEAYQVQEVGPARKAYRCPGCNQMVETGTPHIVAWQEESLLGWESGVNNRRHWHRHCWNRGLQG